ncbi:hypothetical protein V6Z12_D09G210600 [Gossypium hirsutum]
MKIWIYRGSIAKRVHFEEINGCCRFSNQINPFSQILKNNSPLPFPKCAAAAPLLSIISDPLRSDNREMKGFSNDAATVRGGRA